MHSVPLRPCQTSWLGFCLLLLPYLLRAGDAPTAPTPPPWQGELAAARTLQVSLLLAPAQDAAAQEARRARLLKLYGDLATKYPDAAPVQKAAGDDASQLVSLEAAVPYWQRAQVLDPEDPEVADSLGSAYLRAGQVREAEQEYQRAIQGRPDFSAYHTELANVLYLFRKQLVSPPDLPDEQAVLRLALEHFRRAAELSPRDLSLATAYAETFYIFGKPDWTQALAAWQNVLALSGANQDFPNGHLARISLRLQRKADAKAYLAAIQDPAFNVMKNKLLQQADRLPDSPPASTP